MLIHAKTFLTRFFLLNIILTTYSFSIQMQVESSLSSNVLGFLGCGKIGSAMCRGFCSLDQDIRPSKIVVSPRSAENSNSLKSAFPDLVEIASTNEEVVERSNIIFIGLIPNVARQVIPSMPWTTGNKFVVSMMAAVEYSEV
jgi:pyrroline-5-carboxylate reductase